MLALDSEPLVRMLLKFRANVLYRDALGLTAIDYARDQLFNGSTPVVNLLLGAERRARRKVRFRLPPAWRPSFTAQVFYIVLHALIGLDYRV
jgi:hypothetical protein